MFDGQQHTDWDLQMKSILESGQEEVPAHIWEGVSSELDAIAQRRKTMIFWRRAAIGLSAASALAFGLFLNHSSEEIITETAIAEVVEPVSEAEVSIVEETPETEVLVAMVQKKAPAKVVNNGFVSETMREYTETVEASPIADETPAETITEVSPEPVPVSEETASSNWVEDDSELEENGIRTCIVLSGIAGTNSAQNFGQSGVIRKPTLSAAPVKTGISQTEPGDSYGIPLSFGIGTKIGFNSRWSLGVGVNYTLLSRKFYGDYIKVENGQITENLKSDIRNTQHYVGIPVNAYYNIIASKFVNFYAYAGGTIEKCITNEYRVLTKDILHKESVKGVQTSANLGIGVEFMLGKHLGIYIDPSARYYFKCHQPKSIRTAQPLMLGFEMGLRVNL